MVKDLIRIIKRKIKKPKDVKEAHSVVDHLNQRGVYVELLVNKFPHYEQGHGAEPYRTDIQNLELEEKSGGAIRAKGTYAYTLQRGARGDFGQWKPGKTQYVDFDMTLPSRKRQVGMWDKTGKRIFLIFSIVGLLIGASLVGFNLTGNVVGNLSGGEFNWAGISLIALGFAGVLAYFKL